MKEIKMTIRTFNELLRTKPFVPFKVTTRAGEEIEIGHPEMVARHPDESVVIATRGGGSFTVIDLEEFTKADFTVGKKT